MSKLEFPHAAGLLNNPAFSQVAMASGTRAIYTAGQVSIDETGALVGADDLTAQTAQVMRNVGLALKAAGASFNDVVKITSRHHRQGARAVLCRPDAAGKHAGRRSGTGAAGVADRDRGDCRCGLIGGSLLGATLAKPLPELAFGASKYIP